jgi:hypothetical protein
MVRQDGFRRRGYRVAVALLLAAMFVGLVGKFGAAATLILLAVALVAGVEEINAALLRRAVAGHQPREARPLAQASAVSA